MSVLDEEWEADGNELHMSDMDDPNSEVAYFNEPDRAKLASLAPRMARILRELEWAGEKSPECVWCGRRNEHATDCGLHALLRELDALTGEVGR